MSIIWKVELKRVPSVTSIEVNLPIGAQILTAKEQYERIYIWVLVNPEAPMEKRKFQMYWTGEEILKDPGEYIGTFLIREWIHAFHLFEEK